MEKYEIGQEVVIDSVMKVKGIGMSGVQEKIYHLEWTTKKGTIADARVTEEMICGLEEPADLPRKLADGA